MSKSTFITGLVEKKQALITLDEWKFEMNSQLHIKIASGEIRMKKWVKREFLEIIVVFWLGC